MPKNDAVTLVIELAGTLGFTTATAAQVNNGEVILSAGFNVLDATQVSVERFTRATGTPTADLVVRQGTFNADVTARADQDIVIRPTVPLTITGALNADAQRLIDMGGTGATLRIDGPVALGATDVMLGAYGGGSTLISSNVNVRPFVVGGTGTLSVLTGDVTIGGTLTMDAGCAPTECFNFDTLNGGTINVNVGAGRTLAVSGLVRSRRAASRPISRPAWR